MRSRFAIVLSVLCVLAVTKSFGQGRDFRTERLIIDDGNGNTVTIQTPSGPITGGTLTIPDPGGAGQFLISNPSGGSQSVTGDFLPGADDTYDLGSGATRWQDIFGSGNVNVGGQLQFVETGGGTDYVGFQAPAAITANQVWTLPAADGTSGQVLSTDGAGTLNWSTAGGSPSGAAGGDLSGTYPNPVVAASAITGAKIADSTITTADIAPGAAIPHSKLALSNSIQNADIVANAITTSKVANGTVTTSKLADSAVSGLKLLTFAVQSRHLADGAVTLSKVSTTGASSGDVIGYNGTNIVWTAGGGGSPTGAAGGDLSGTYPNPVVATGAITGAKIADSTITTADIAPSAAIPYSKLALSNSIQNADIVANAITTSKVANGTVTTSKLADSAVSGLKLLTFAVQNRHLASNAVTPDKISPTGASSGDVLRYNGSTVAWGSPASSGTSFNHTVVSATTYSVATADDIIGCDVSANGITITLPAANSVPAGKMLIIRVENGDASVAGRSISINRNGTDLINYSQTTLTINQGTGVPGTAFRLFSDGVNQWWQW